MVDCILAVAQLAIAMFVGWRAAHCKFECDLDSPMLLWERVVRVVTG